MKRITSLILALMLTLCLFSCKKEETDSVIIMQSESYTITLADFQYYMVTVYNDFASQYGDMINYMLDTTKPLRDQKCPVDQSGKMTWFDYVAEGAVDSLKLDLTHAEQAIDEGLSLSEDDKRLIKEGMEKLAADAKEGGYASVEDLVKARFGKHVTTETVEKCSTLSALANAHRNKIYNEKTYTEEDYLAYAKENPASCYYADFMYMRMNADIKDGMTDAEKKAEWEKVKKTASAFCEAVKDKESFFKESEKYLRSICTIVEDEKDSDAANNKLTEEQFQANLKGAETKEVAYATGAANVDWIFAKDRAAGDKSMISNEENYTCEIIYMLKPAYLSQVATVDIRHIYIKKSDEGDDYKARTKAESILKEWKEGEASEYTFSILAAEHSADDTTSTKGGIYEDVVAGQLAAELNDWCFDEGRKPGDVELIKVGDNYHIVYFSEKGMPRWKGAADKALREAALGKNNEELAKSHSLTVNTDNIAKCPDLFGN